jgi:hypothetical protein
VRDGGGEACAELLVGVRVAATDVDEPLAAAVEVVRDDEHVVAVREPRRSREALGQPVDRLASAPAGGDDAVLGIQHDEQLSALLEQ